MVNRKHGQNNSSSSWPSSKDSSLHEQQKSTALTSCNSTTLKLERRLTLLSLSWLPSIVTAIMHLTKNIQLLSAGILYLTSKL